MRYPLFRLSACTLFLAIAACNRTPPSAQDPESAASTFFAALEKGNAKAAYDSAAFGFQAAQTYDAFLSKAREIGLIGAQPPGWIRKQASASEVRLDGTLGTAGGQTLNISVVLTPDGHSWKLFSLDTGSGSRYRDNRFTLVGKGTGFNDAYHQPMPDADKLDELVRRTMSLFNDAIRTGDFLPFYQELSQRMRDVYPEAILTNHFQDFVEKKPDLSTVANLRPEYDQPPIINEEGLLRIKGHFDTLPDRVFFAFKYTYELPKWKLSGIEIGLRK